MNTLHNAELKGLSNSVNFSWISILNVFYTDPKSAALKNAMAKRRYNAVILLFFFDLFKSTRH